MRRPRADRNTLKHKRRRDKAYFTPALILRNIAGLALISVGLVLWLLPIVPGAILMVPGVMLLDFPGKRALIRRLEQQSWIKKALKNGPIAKIWRSVRRAK